MKHTPLRRKTRLRPRSRGYDPVHRWGPPGYLTFLHGQPCCVPRCHALLVEAAHVPSLSQGGDWHDLLPLCDQHHRLGPGAHHRIGTAAFLAHTLPNHAAVRTRLANGWAVTQA